MDIRSVAAVAAVCLLLGACETLNPHKMNRSALSLVDAESATIGTVFVWSNDQNAGLVTKDSKVCMQRAMTARSMAARVDGEAETSIPAGTFSELTAAAGAASAQNNAEAAATISAAIAQTATALSATSERTAFLDIGMFYLCQLSANQTLTGNQPAELTLELIEAAAGMTPTGVVPAANAPTLPRSEQERDRE